MRNDIYGHDAYITAISEKTTALPDKKSSLKGELQLNIALAQDGLLPILLSTLKSRHKDDISISRPERHVTYKGVTLDEVRLYCSAGDRVDATLSFRFRNIVTKALEKSMAEGKKVMTWADVFARSNLISNFCATIPGGVSSMDITFLRNRIHGAIGMACVNNLFRFNGIAPEQVNVLPMFEGFVDKMDVSFGKALVAFHLTYGKQGATDNSLLFEGKWEVEK